MRAFGRIVAVIAWITSLGLQAAEPVQPPNDATERKEQAEEPALSWRNVKDWGVEGRAFSGMERKDWFDRLPAIAEGKVTKNVWELGQDSSGMVVRFKTDATEIWANYTLRRARIAPPNLTAIGASGLDLYARDPEGKWRWVGVTRPTAGQVRQVIGKGMSAGMREYMLYLPLYNGVHDLEIGLPPQAKFEPVAPRSEKPLVFYGTSITQGASASRPGMTHTAILGRRLDRAVINLGFSGNGRMDAEVGELLVKIDAAVYVIDCLPNMNAEAVRQKCIPLVKQLRAAKPEVPILLVEDRRNTNAWVTPARNKHHDQNHLALRECLDKLKADGISGIYYLSGDKLLGDDGEASTDGSHPSDLGFMRQADQFEPVLKGCLAPN